MATPTRPLEDFFPLVRPYAPMASEPFIEQALRLAAIQFCERTRAWRYKTERQINQNQPIVVCPSYATVFEIETAAFNGNALKPTQYTDLDLGQDITTGSPDYITQANPGAVIIFPFSPGKLSISVFLKPKAATDAPVTSEYNIAGNDDFNVLPEFLLIQHGEAIANGALARILTMPNQPFTDLQMGVARGQMFEGACDNHFNHQIRGEQRAPARSKPRFF